MQYIKQYIYVCKINRNTFNEITWSLFPWCLWLATMCYYTPTPFFGKFIHCACLAIIPFIAFLIAMISETYDYIKMIKLTNKKIKVKIRRRIINDKNIYARSRHRSI